MVRDPLPPPEEGVDFQLLRRSLNINPSDHWASPETFQKLSKSDVQRIKRLSRDFFPKHNPFIRRIVRRTRDYLENTIDLQTNEPYLQRLGSLINLDLLWNPTRLEQRKGRIQRIGQVRSEVLIYNMRYRGSVEDRVHQLLSESLGNIRNMFGQLLHTLEDVWIAAALRDEEEAKRVIDAVPKRHPFEMRYDRIETVDWESCSRVLDSASQLEALRKRWRDDSRF
jgi:hypothetical protein